MQSRCCVEISKGVQMMRFDYIVKKHTNSKLVTKYCIHDAVKNYGIMSETTFNRFKTILKLDDKKVLYVNAARASSLSCLSDF